MLRPLWQGICCVRKQHYILRVSISSVTRGSIFAKDGRGTRQAFEFPPLGEGAVDWSGLARAMVETEYRGFIAVEYEAHFLAKGYPKHPIGAARQSKAFLDEVFSEWLSSRAS